MGVTICIVGVGIRTGVGVGSAKGGVIVATGVETGPEGAIILTNTRLTLLIVRRDIGPSAQSGPVHLICDPPKWG